MADLPQVIGTLRGALALALGQKRWAARHMLLAEFTKYGASCRENPGDRDGNAMRLRWMAERDAALDRLAGGAEVSISRDLRWRFVFSIEVGGPHAG